MCELEFHTYENDTYVCDEHICENDTYIYDMQTSHGRGISSSTDGSYYLAEYLHLCEKSVASALIVTLDPSSPGTIAHTITATISDCLR
jgi:hypothetical protein